MIVAMHRNRRAFIADMPADVPAARGLETTVAVVNAKQFPGGQTEIDTFVASMNGPAGTYVAVTIP